MARANPIMQAARERENLRAAQARSVMPLIGPLLDAWEQVPNDLRSDIVEQSPDLAEHLCKIEDAMESDADNED